MTTFFKKIKNFFKRTSVLANARTKRRCAKHNNEIQIPAQHSPSPERIAGTAYHRIRKSPDRKLYVQHELHHYGNGHCTEDIL